MKADQIAGRCILAGVFAYLLIQIYYLSCYMLPLAYGKSWEDFAVLFLVQSIFFAVCILAAFILLLFQQRKQYYTSPFTSLLLVTGDGKIKNEVFLQDKHSFLITGRRDGKEVFIESGGNPESGRHLYGICNLACGRWYLEAASDSRPVGLRRGNEDAIYRLKEGIPYQLSAEDVIYADTCKVVIRARA